MMASAHPTEVRAETSTDLTIMQEFYKKALQAVALLLIADVLLAVICIYLSYPSLALLPATEDSVHWHYAGYTDVADGGTSTIHILDPKRERLRFDYTLTEVARYPFASAELSLDDGKGHPAVVDWSKYSSVTFNAKCAPAGSMALILATFDEKVSTLGKPLTYRPSGSFFSCNARGVPVALDLTRLVVPEWWLHTMKLDLSDQGYKLDKALKIVFGSSANSRRNLESRVEISEVVLHGRDYRYIWGLALCLLGGWSVFGVWFFRAHSRALTASLDFKMKKDLPLVAYRQLTLEPYKDKEKATVLRFIATNYTNTELDLECVVSSTGANRNKVNEVLKTELGMTFTSYLNKLRLTEAARLLAENSSAAVAEIAYSVGYANVSYFNKLFKEEYGCTPKAFRSLATQQGNPAERLSEASCPTSDTPD